MVEINKGYSDFIKKTVERIGFKQIKIFHADVFTLIPHVKDRYHIIFADPPYDLSRIQEIPGIIFDHDLLERDGWFILEHGKGYDFSDQKYFKELRKYGNVYFSVFVNK